MISDTDCSVKQAYYRIMIGNRLGREDMCNFYCLFQHKIRCLTKWHLATQVQIAKWSDILALENQSIYFISIRLFGEYCEDIVKMFRQIQRHPEDTDLQRILWFGELKKCEISDFWESGMIRRLYLAICMLLQLASDEEHRFIGDPRKYVHGWHTIGRRHHAGSLGEQDSNRSLV